MSLFSLLKGTRETIFAIGGHLGIRAKNDAVNGGGVPVMRILRNDEDTHANLMHADASSSDNGSTSLHSATVGDVMDKNPLITQGFSGASAPTASSNTGKYYFCHTSGGAYTAGYIYKAEILDKSLDGASTVGWVEIDLEENGQFLTTSASYTTAGSPALLPNAIYGYEGGAWVLKGSADSTADDGWQTVALPFTTTDVLSTVSVPINAIITEITFDIQNTYSALTDIKAKVGTQVVGTLSSTERYAHQYIEQTKTLATTGGQVCADLTGATGGTGVLYVSYVVPQT